MDADQVEIELKKLELENRKLVFETEKLKVERFKAWTGIPLLTVAATVALAIWTQYQKTTDDFALKAADIVMSATTANGVANKAFALKKVFPDRLPENFASSFDPKTLPYVAAPLEPALSHLELISLLAPQSASTPELVKLLRALYPNDPKLALVPNGYGTRPANEIEIGARSAAPSLASPIAAKPRPADAQLRFRQLDSGGARVCDPRSPSLCQ